MNGLTESIISAQRNIKVRPLCTNYRIFIQIFNKFNNRNHWRGTQSHTVLLKWYNVAFYENVYFLCIV